MSQLISVQATIQNNHIVLNYSYDDLTTRQIFFPQKLTYIEVASRTEIDSSNPEESVQKHFDTLFLRNQGRQAKFTALDGQLDYPVIINGNNVNFTELKDYFVTNTAL